MTKREKVLATTLVVLMGFLGSTGHAEGWTFVDSHLRCAACCAVCGFRSRVRTWREELVETPE